MLPRLLLVTFLLGIGIVFSPNTASAGCDVDEVIWLLNNKGYTPDQVRQKCRNEVNDVRQCSLSKVIKMAQDGMTKQKIYKLCVEK